MSGTALSRTLEIFWLAAGGSWCSLAPSTLHAQTAELVAEGLEIPRDLAFTPDGRILVTERPGRVRVVEHGELLADPWITLDVAHVQDGGLLGIALAPDFERSGGVFVAVTVHAGDGTWENRVLRLTDTDGRGTDPQVIVSGIPSFGPHRGGAVAFGPDGMLYVSTGDGRDLSAPQDRGALAGKILRYAPDGSIPEDNPHPGSPVWAVGVRNPQALAWHPETGELFAIEHGPSDFDDEEGRRHEDELNVIVPGGNYGWPVLSGAVTSRGFIPPLVEWTPAIAPGGLTFYDDERASEWHGNAFVGGMRGEHLRRLVLEADPGSDPGWRVVSDELWFDGVYGRIRAVAMGPDGALYFTTTNTDRDDAVRRSDGLYRVELPMEG